MGRFAEYVANLRSSDEAMRERRKQLKKISELRGGRDVLVFASDFNKAMDAPTLIDHNDVLSVQDQLENMSGDAIDILLVTMGGYGEVVEEIVKIIRCKYNHVGIIIPAHAKSAGTIFAMAGDEILMGAGSTLGPIDGQVVDKHNQISVDAFLDGFNRIKKEMEDTNKLNPAYIPMLQTVSLGDIESYRRIQAFSRRVVTDWLTNYKFKDWRTHKNGKVVTEKTKRAKANQIARNLGSQKRWLTHERSIRIEDLRKLGLQIIDYSQNKPLNDAITRYYMVLMISFERTSMYKLFETTTSQLGRVVIPTEQASPPIGTPSVMIDVVCSQCGYTFKVQLNLQENMALYDSVLPYPIRTDIMKCPRCDATIDLSTTREKIEGELGRKGVE